MTEIHVHDNRIENRGQPRKVSVADPLPQWLEDIVIYTHPVTGKNPFAFGNDHVYGSFNA